ncbi:aminodeoxychorismate synthase, component I [Terribacillus saccharophilus]|uniref:aminodeoxychorismate synthase component I n=1 Tax=Terribacillus saccharophilus TaxID=361277 RepID=UPI000BA7248A|nr:aminodeoxychorismate synthase component I [Terribacillus saccharophilus]PAF39726.1 aminodeoxychorismate synthase, component I [Terribacillus saccharophilus]
MYAYFNFADANGKTQHRRFTEQHTLLTAYTIDEVIPCLEQVQVYTEQGYYAAGYLSYEAAGAFDPSYVTAEGSKLPLLQFGIYKTFSKEQPESIGEAPIKLNWQPAISKTTYNQAIQTIKEEIAAGNTYQTNYTMRLRTAFAGDSAALFRQMQRAQRADYTAYLSWEDTAILSASPELFFRWDGERIITKPMKGTIKRGLTYTQDLEQLETLAASVKDRAENVMIVDLLRNDISRVAKLGSVHVPALYTIEKYPTVYQMTSTVEAETVPGTTITNIMRALFPCGSITGAPKASTMKVISTLEPEPREVYCGAIGYIEPGGEAVFNVPIRTAIVDKAEKQATYSVGGGITWDSTAGGEYEEAIAKSSVLQEQLPDFELLETLAYSSGVFLLEDRHIRRLLQSADYFSIPVKEAAVRKLLHQHQIEHPEQSHRIRLLADQSGQLELFYSEMPALIKNIQYFALAATPIDRKNRYYYHKTTFRKVYKDYKIRKSDVFDTLLWNEAGELTEFTIGNLVIEQDDKLLTPPVTSGLLPGTLREELLEKGTIQEAVLTKADLQTSSRIWLINSVRGWVEMEPVH